MMPRQNPKITKHGQEARDAAIKGIEIVYDAVSATLGPRSSNVAIARPYGRPSVVHDGVTVAKEVLPLADPFQNVGAELAVEAADKTNSVGDGTTTATVLIHAIATKAHTYITAGSKPMALRAGIESAVSEICGNLVAMATPIDSTPDVQRIATVSAQNDEIGKMVADAYDELGAEGIMSVEESRGVDSYLEIKTGMEIDRGYASPVFMTDQLLKEATVEKTYVLVTDYQIHSTEQFAPLMEQLFNEGVKRIVVFAGSIEGEALAFLAVNNHQQNIKALAVNAPSFGDRRTEILQDIATITNATFVSASGGISLESVNKAYLGTAGRITATEKSTLILEGAGASEDVKARAEAIKAQAENPDTGEFDREKLMERYAKLESGVAVLHIGAHSESEVKERKERAIDAISAAKAALSEGIVPGGGTALIAASLLAVPGLKEHPRRGQRDFDAGVRIVLDACRAPFDKLLSNAGYDPGEKWAELKRMELKNYGFDVTSGELVDLVEVGIIDPVLVVKSALQNAASNAIMVATTSVIIVEQPPKEAR